MLALTQVGMPTSLMAVTHNDPAVRVMTFSVIVMVTRPDFLAMAVAVLMACSRSSRLSRCSCRLRTKMHWIYVMIVTFSFYLPWLIIHLMITR